MELSARFESFKYDLFQRRTALSIPAKLSLALGFAVLTGLLAQIKFYLPFTPVPVTMQTFAVLLAGVTLGRWWGGASMALYAGLGIAGIPWFANGGSGFGPTFGYLFGFILAATLIGYLTDRISQGFSFSRIFGLMAGACVFLIYIPGCLWLGSWLGLSGREVNVSSIISMGVLPFIAGDVIKIFIAALIGMVITPKRNATDGSRLPSRPF
ncbi:biotin transporter BioY [Dehalogenimonas sp. 4OHTPN]|uniref:Biotin transporter n=1 Tax=Dehalogenimonas sp. 4OHTPN TaxID=3166643 RepID=A0AAU8GDM7_9CHLR